MLRVEGLQASYGRSQVLFDVSLAIAEGEMVTLLGRNGMGKTTSIRTILGLTPVQAGKIEFLGHDVTGRSTEAIARAGIGLVPEGRQVFPTLRVRENLVATAANRRRRADPWTLQRVYELFPRLGERQEQMAGTLSGGEQQMLAVARALVCNPRFLLMDEPTEGLSPYLVEELKALIVSLRQNGLAILLVEQNLAFAVEVADFVHVMDKGKIVFAATPDVLWANEQVKETYLGV
jgi:branched-chain amino acid transport system ATP-binding protein